jgi:SAM-dependent methyltransferase
VSAEFDAYSARYDDLVQRSIDFAGVKHEVFLRAKVRELADIFQRHFGTERPSLLDVGCGVGAMHGPLAPITSRLAGCDLSKTSITVARSRNPTVVYREQQGNALPFDDGAFDASLAVCVFHHVPASEREVLLREMRRTTRQGGLVLVIEHNPLNPLTRLAVARCELDRDAVLLTASTWRQTMAKAGLKDVRSRHFLLAPSAGERVGRLERPFHGLPLGAQYVAFGEV